MNEVEPTQVTENKRPKKVILIVGITLLVVISTIVGYLIFAKIMAPADGVKTPVKVCSPDTLEKLMTAIEKKDEDGGLDLVAKIVSQANYANDPNCLYAVMKYYDGLGDSPSLGQVDAFDKAYNSDVGLDSSLSISKDDVKKFQEESRRAAQEASDKDQTSPELDCSDGVGCTLNTRNYDLDEIDKMGGQ
jgi:hypothetical protein